MNMDAVAAEKPKYLGAEIHFYESAFNLELAKYERFCESMRPLAVELARIGLPPLTDSSFARLKSGFQDQIIDQFRDLANKDASKIGFIFRPAASGAIENGVQALTKFLDGFYNVFQSNVELETPPVVKGTPTVTDEFKHELREKHTMRIRSESGAAFYEKFLTAQDLIREMMELGYYPEQAFDWDGTDGLYLKNVSL